MRAGGFKGEIGNLREVVPPISQRCDKSSGSGTPPQQKKPRSEGRGVNWRVMGFAGEIRKAIHNGYGALLFPSLSDEPDCCPQLLASPTDALRHATVRRRSQKTEYTIRPLQTFNVMMAAYF
jgi:hypothetical protein